jgi:formamidopyrimidine-DNA glycosylase
MTLEGSRITHIFRTGKYIIMELKKAQRWSNDAEYLYLLTHLAMSGAYLINTTHRHERIKFTLDDNVLIYKDMRYFGTLKILDADGLKSYIESKKLGVDAFTKTRYDFEMQLIKKVYEPRYKRKTIKNLLLDQTIISGLGNIYACEVLFASGIHPLKTPAEIGFNEIKLLARNIEGIIALSYEVGGSSIKDYTGVDGQEGGFSEYMEVYGRKGQPCNACKSTIEVVKVDGRSSFYCPTCQEVG